MSTVERVVHEKDVSFCMLCDSSSSYKDCTKNPLSVVFKVFYVVIELLKPAGPPTVFILKSLHYTLQEVPGTNTPSSTVKQSLKKSLLF